MLNLDCRLEKRRRYDTLEDSAEAALYEASRCLGNLSCEACDLCRFLCPDLAITRNTDSGEIQIDLSYCKGCGICAAICPKGAITMEKE